jgi:ribosomal protein L11 methyltransferase
MTMGRLAVIGVEDADQADAATGALAALGATHAERRAAGAGHTLISGHFDAEEVARSAVAALRARGWAAAQRPADDEPALFAWRNRTQPVSIGQGRLMICLPWAEWDRGAGPVVEIDPGGAFGAGAHPTTQLLLEAVAEGLQGGETVLDVGCGSGVLAVAAIRLGAASATAIDIDPAAVLATRANAERNRMTPNLTALATPLHDLPGAFDVVLANIGKDVLVEMSLDLRRLLKPGGWLGLSGFSPAQVSTLAAQFRELRVLATPQLDDWSALLALHPQG